MAHKCGIQSMKHEGFEAPKQRNPRACKTSLSLCPPKADDLLATYTNMAQSQGPCTDAMQHSPDGVNQELNA
jgi:hypothetical protein